MPQVSQFSIPHLCKNTAILRIVVLVELFAIVITVAQANRFWLQELGLTSLYMQWIALSSTAVLCWLRRTINRQAIGVRLVGVFAVCFKIELLSSTM